LQNAEDLVSLMDVWRVNVNKVINISALFKVIEDDNVIMCDVE